jgi:DNA-binding Lrp family transcriptional regulator
MDKEDLKIVLLLIVNSRLTYREIADYLGLSVNAVYKRINTLVNLGIIQQFTARIKSYAINSIYAYFFGECEVEDSDLLSEELGKHPNTALLMFSSRNYLYIGSFLKTLNDLDEYSSFVSQKAKMKSPQIGFLSGVHSASQIPYITPKETPVKYGELDKAIIRSLHRDSRKPISEVAEEVRSTANTVSRKIEKMYEEGLLELSINFYPEASNDIFSVFRIELDPSVNRDEIAKELMDRFSPHIFFIWVFSNIPNFMQCWVWCNNMKQLNDIIKAIRKERIESFQSDIIHKAAFFDTWKEDLLYD